MTQEDQYIIIGKAHEDYKAAKRDFALIEQRGYEIQNTATNLAAALERNPATVLVPEGDQGVVVAGVQRPFVFTDDIARNLSREYIGNHVKEYRTAKQKVAALRQQLISLGQEPGE